MMRSHALVVVSLVAVVGTVGSAWAGTPCEPRGYPSANAPARGFTTNTTFHALGRIDLDGSGPSPERLVAHPRTDGAEFGEPALLGGEQVGGELWAWDGLAGAWEAIPGQFLNAALLPRGRVSEMKLHDADGDGPGEPVLVAVGEFARVGEVPAVNVAAWSASTGWSAVGAATALGPRINDVVSGEALGLGSGEGVKLVVGGLLNAGGAPAGAPQSGVAVWDGASWQILGVPAELGVGAEVRALAIFDADGPGPEPALLYAASTFATRYWSGTGWDPITPGLSNGTYDMTVWNSTGFGPRLVFVGEYPGIEETQFVPARVVLWDGLAKTVVPGFPFERAVRASAFTFAPTFEGATDALAVSGESIASRGFVDGGVAIYDGSWDTVARHTASPMPLIAGVDDDGDGPNGPSLVIADAERGAPLTDSDDQPLDELARYEGFTVGRWVNASESAPIDNPNLYMCGDLAFSSSYLVLEDNVGNRLDDNRTMTIPTGGWFLRGIAVYDDQTTIELNGQGLDLIGAGAAFDAPAIVIGGGLANSARLTFVSAPATSNVTSWRPVLVGVGQAGEGVDSELRIRQGVDARFGALLVGVDPGSSGQVTLSPDGVLTRLEVVQVFPEVQPRLLLGGAEGSSGAMTVGDGAEFYMFTGGVGDVTVGEAGNGQLTVQPGGQFFLDAASMRLAVEPGSDATFTADGRVGMVSPLDVGVGGDATLSVGQGSRFTLQRALRLGVEAGSVGRVIARGADTIFEAVSSGVVNVGVDGTGVLSALDSATVDIATRIDIGARGQLGGDGLVRFVESGAVGVLSRGVVSPASASPSPTDPTQPSVATLTIEGPYVQERASASAGSAGRLLIDVDARGPGPLAHDRLSVIGVAELGGQLDVRLMGNVPPAMGAIGAGIEVVSASTLTGAFEVANFPGLPPNEAGRGRFFRFVTQANQRGGSSVVIVEDVLADDIEAGDAQDYSLGGAGTSAALGDLDNDGDRDLVVTVPDPADPVNNAGSIVILFNGGTTGGMWAGFTSTRQVLVGRNPSDVAIAEFDGEPGLDIAVTNQTDGTLAILTNPGTGEFGPPLAEFTYEVGAGPVSVTASDIDLNGSVDALVALGTEQRVVLLLNSGNDFRAWTGLAVSASIGLAGAPTDAVNVDVDDDKFDDVVTPQPSERKVTVSRNRLGGARGIGFDEPVDVAVPGEPVAIATGDLNLDGRRDVVVALANTNQLAVLVNNGTASFQSPLTIPAGTGPTSVTLGRLDADADLDIAVVTSNAQGQRVVRLIRNDLFGGQLQFAFQADLQPGSAPAFVLAGDVTNDGADDLVSVNAGGNVRGVGGSSDLSVFTFEVCRGDANNDRAIDLKDIQATLANFSNDYRPGTGPGDSNGDGVVTFRDVITSLAEFGVECR